MKKLLIASTLLAATSVIAMGNGPNQGGPNNGSDVEWSTHVEVNCGVELHVNQGQLAIGDSFDEAGIEFTLYNNKPGPGHNQIVFTDFVYTGFDYVSYPEQVTFIQLDGQIDALDGDAWFENLQRGERYEARMRTEENHNITAGDVKVEALLVQNCY